MPGSRWPSSRTTDGEGHPGEVAPIVHGITLGPVAHGGQVVARHEGRVVFVRHGLPGEVVDVALTDVSSDSFHRGDVVAVHEASSDRVMPPCPIAGECGGCDFQHVRLGAQRELKRRVVADQLQRLAGLAWDGAVEEVDGAPDGLHWRTRVRYACDADGNLAMRRHRSHSLVRLPPQGCLLASPTIPPPEELAPLRRPRAELSVVGAASGDAVLVSTPRRGQRSAAPELVRGEAELRERAGGHEWIVPASAFWQVHVHAADVLLDAVAEPLAPQYGESAFDLYCGVGLFSGMLAGSGVRTWGVESSREAVAAARRNVPSAHILAGQVEHVLSRLPDRADLVVLDPPRPGAGRRVVENIVSRKPRAVAYVACDPAALARDVATFAGHGYAVASLRAFDLFPMTHHVECVAVLTLRSARS